MRILNKHTKFLTLLLAVAAMTGCSEDKMDSINTDKDHPHSVPAKFTFADVITSTAQYNVGGDVNTYASVYNEQTAGIDNQLYNADIRQGEPSSSTMSDNVWKNIYGTITNAKLVYREALTAKGDKIDHQIRGCAAAMLAYNLALTTDIFGDTPWSQAADDELKSGMPAYMNPVIDKQQDIYKDVFALLDTATVNLQKVSEEDNSLGSYDLMYNGNPAKWLKFVNGLKARYTMRLLSTYSDAEKSAKLQQVINFADASFTSASDEAAFNAYNGTSNWNPVFDFWESRQGIATSESLYKKLTARKDPRLYRCFFNYDFSDYDAYQVKPGDKGFAPAPNGQANLGIGSYTFDAFDLATQADVDLLSYREVLFLKAEAYARLGQKSEAEKTLKEAVAASFDNAEKDIQYAKGCTQENVTGFKDNEAINVADTVNNYFNNEVRPLFEANPVKEVMIQKYLSFWNSNGEATETFCDIRRLLALGEFDYYGLGNPANGYSNGKTIKFPLRFPYGASGVTANPNIEKAYGNGSYIYTNPVWWAGGNN